MTEIFLSHASTDDTRVTEIHKKLKELTEFDLWVDHLRLSPPKHNWRNAIHQAMKDCTDGVLLVLSRTSVTRPEVDGEWTFCLNVDRPLYVLKLDDVSLIDINPRLHVVQWIDASKDFNLALQTLAAVFTGKLLPPNAPILHIRKTTGNIPRNLKVYRLQGRDTDVEKIKSLLSSAPTCIVGVGGLGKSKLAAEVALTYEGIQGVIWHSVNSTSYPDQLNSLLLEHFDLSPTTELTEVVKQMSTRRCLIVLDNAEDVLPNNERYFAYIELIETLLNHNAYILITSRVEWTALKLAKKHEPTELSAITAQQLVLEMARIHEVPDLEQYAHEIALHGLNHPRLIEWAIEQMTHLPLTEVINDLKTRQSHDAQVVLNEMIQLTVDKMITNAAYGKEANLALQRLLVCRGGFTFDAALPITGLDKDSLSAALKTLTTWRFVRFDLQHQRYDVPLLVIAAVSPDDIASRPHYEYYKSLANQHGERQDYYGLDVESDNLEVAFEWAMQSEQYEDAYWLANKFSDFLVNRGRFNQLLSWFSLLTKELENHSNLSLRANLYISLGIVYTNNPIGNRVTNIKTAIDFYHFALEYWTREKDLVKFAMIQNYLGVAYAKLAWIEEPIDNLQLAIEYFGVADNYQKSQTDSSAQMMTLNNLATAHKDLARIKDQTDNLHQSAKIYRKVLEYRSPETKPVSYGVTLQNLGTVYLELAKIEDRESNQNLALNAFQSALIYLTPLTAPLHYAGINRNLGIIYEDRNDLISTLSYWREAERYYRQTEAIADADLMLRWIAEAEDTLKWRGDTEEDGTE